MSLTAVLIGSTGLVGSSLLQQLLANKAFEKVVAFSRRPITQQHPKLKNIVIDFSLADQYADQVKGDVFFSCLGTTKKQAGSIAAQRIVDLDYQLAFAHMAAENKIPHYCLVSSSGANANSAASYMKMKGELEEHVKQLGFQRVTIFQPSLLLGQRPEHRFGEAFGAVFLPALCRLPGLRRYRPIKGEQVATKMLETALSPGQGLQVCTLDKVFPNTDRD